MKNFIFLSSLWNNLHIDCTIVTIFCMKVDKTKTNISHVEISRTAKIQFYGKFIINYYLFPCDFRRFSLNSDIELEIKAMINVCLIYTAVCMEDLSKVHSVQKKNEVMFGFLNFSKKMLWRVLNFRRQ